MNAYKVDTANKSLPTPIKTKGLPFAKKIMVIVINLS
jgi:hypothetical protein